MLTMTFQKSHLVIDKNMWRRRKKFPEVFKRKKGSNICFMWELYHVRLLQFIFPKRGHLSRGNRRLLLWGTVLVTGDSDKCHLTDGPANPTLGSQRCTEDSVIQVQVHLWNNKGKRTSHALQLLCHWCCKGPRREEPSHWDWPPTGDTEGTREPPRYTRGAEAERTTLALSSDVMAS